MRFASDREMRRLNHRFRGKDQPTDVLSFPGAGAAGAGASPRARHRKLGTRKLGTRKFGTRKRGTRIRRIGIWGTS